MFPRRFVSARCNFPGTDIWKQQDMKTNMNSKIDAGIEEIFLTCLVCPVARPRSAFKQEGRGTTPPTGQEWSP